VLYIFNKIMTKEIEYSSRIRSDGITEKTREDRAVDLDVQLALIDKIKTCYQLRMDLESGNGSLSRSDRADLAKIIKRQEKAEEALVENNIGLVKSIAIKYAKRKNNGPLDLDDFILVGRDGLRTAASHVGERYDENLAKFGTYAYYWIDAAIRREIQNKGGGLIRIPVWYQDFKRKYEKAEETLWQSLGRQPTGAELAEKMDTTPDELNRLLLNDVKTVNFSKLELRNKNGDVDAVDRVDRHNYHKIADKSDSFRPTENTAFYRILKESIWKRIRRVLKGRVNLFEDEDDFSGILPPEGGIEGLSRKLNIPVGALRNRRSKARLDGEQIVKEYFRGSD